MMIGEAGSSAPLASASLRASQTVHLEAAPVLYGSNTFHFSYPVIGLDWLNGIGAKNVALLRDVRIFVEATVNQSSKDGWPKLLQKLGRDAKGLRWLHIYFDQEGMHRGLGRDGRFVQALAEIKSLESVEIGGFYSRDWPEYLEERMGARVLRI